MFDFLIGQQDYPYNAELFAKVEQIDVDDEPTFEGAVFFKYRRVYNKKATEQLITGMKQTRQAIVIRTKYEGQFKNGDRIKIRNDVWTVKFVEEVENDLYKDSKIIYEHFSDLETELTLA